MNYGLANPPRILGFQPAISAGDARPPVMLPRRRPLPNKQETFIYNANNPVLSHSDVQGTTIRLRKPLSNSGGMPIRRTHTRHRQYCRLSSDTLDDTYVIKVCESAHYKGREIPNPLLLR
ncbi:hypothetical protein PGTUg99_028330 [Puccinia graminis f. sp. tritici]|uniref:Uncharacterized protein n=1 Tax=Puccinia graminis f. sp. tritici TaxID=56615 RepID=A0A5B0N0N7_PUCGR|nr:hypothetical protein PGTUg99_028330 [Puccinia graminis f. sp. tritici]